MEMQNPREWWANLTPEQRQNAVAKAMQKSAMRSKVAMVAKGMAQNTACSTFAAGPKNLPLYEGIPEALKKVGPMTVVEVADAMALFLEQDEVSRSTVLKYINRLISEGRVMRVGRKCEGLARSTLYGLPPAKQAQ